MNRDVLLRMPVLGPLARWLYSRLFRVKSAEYWEKRYSTGGNSGAGSYGSEAEFKANFLNQILVRNQIQTVIEFGCGDGNQLSLINYKDYIGIDVSASAVELCRRRFSHFKFFGLNEWDVKREEKRDLALSLDVIYHCVEEQVFEEHLKAVFQSASKLVVLYTTNRRQSHAAPHIVHRDVTQWIATRMIGWRLVERRSPLPECDFASKQCCFFVYQTIASPTL